MYVDMKKFVINHLISRIIENVGSGSEFDLAYVSIVEEDGTYGSKGNCFSDNTFTTSAPADASERAHASPIPLPAPVTIATFPSNLLPLGGM